jgi:hypothetical protein
MEEDGSHKYQLNTICFPVIYELHYFISILITYTGKSILHSASRDKK